MTQEATQEIRQFLLPQLEQESAMTRKLLAAAPAENCDYKPSDLCMTSLALASHIALSEVFFLRGVLNGAFEWKPVAFQTPVEALAYYDEHVAALIAEVGTLPRREARPADYLCDLDGAGRGVPEYWTETYRSSSRPAFVLFAAYGGQGALHLRTQCGRAAKSGSRQLAA
jgi:hypothetical protein